METKRLKLHERLIDVLDSNNVYFQPPENLKMNYPAIVYTRTNINGNYADNSIYKRKYTYEITVIDQDPTSKIVERMLALPCCAFKNHFVSEGLNHDVFILTL